MNILKNFVRLITRTKEKELLELQKRRRVARECAAKLGIEYHPIYKREK